MHPGRPLVSKAQLLGGRLHNANATYHGVAAAL